MTFLQVKGQLFAKRAIEVAVAGGHNILIKGSPEQEKVCWQNVFPEYCRGS